MTADLGRRERKKLQTREALIAAAIRLFGERGFLGTTIEDLTEAVDVSPRTFFRYFSSKEDLLIADMATAIPLVREALAPARPGEPIIEAVRRATVALVRAFTAPESLAQRRLALSIAEVRGRMLEAHEQINQALVDELARRLSVDPDLDPRPRVVASIALGAVRAAVHAWVASGGHADPEVIVERTFDLVASGLAGANVLRPARAPMSGEA